MITRIEKPGIVNRLLTRLGLNPSAQAGVLGFSPIIIGQTNIDELLRNLSLQSGAVSVTGIGTWSLLTVPSKKRWIPLYYEIYLDTGVYTFTRLYIANPAGTNIKLAEFVATTNQPGSLTHMSVPEGWSFAVYANAYTSTGSLVMRLLVEQEDMY